MRSVQDVLSSIPTIHSIQDLEVLCDSVGLIGDKTKALINVGSYRGGSSAALLIGMDLYSVTGELSIVGQFRYHSPGGPAAAIPTLDAIFRERNIVWTDSFLGETKANVAKFSGDRKVNFFQGFSDDINLDLIGGTSLIFLDADHSIHGCLLDILKYTQKLVAGGVLVLHDCVPSSSVDKALQVFLTIRPTFKADGLIKEGSSIVRVWKG